MKIEIIENSTAFAACRDEWNDLLQRSSCDHVFLTHEWVSAWWDIFGSERSLFVVCVRNGSTLSGIAPLYLEDTHLPLGISISRLGILGDVMVGSDFLDLIVAPDQAGETRKVLWDTIKSAKAWDAFSLRDIDESSETIPALKALATDDGYRYAVHPCFPCPWMPLPDTWEEFMDRPDKIFKRIVRREGIKKVSRRHDVEVELKLEPHELDNGLEQLFALHAERFKLKGMHGSLEDKAMMAFYKRAAPALAANGWLRLSALRIDNQTEAMEFGLFYGKRYYSIQGGCSEHGLDLRAGNILQYRIIESLIGNTNEYHFLRGAEKYKYQWGCSDKNTVMLLLGKGAKGAFFLLYHRLLHLRRCLGEKRAHYQEHRQRAKAKRTYARKKQQQAAIPKTTGKQLQIKIIDNAKDFDALHTSWNKLVARSNCNHPFLKHEWLRTWWDVLGKDLSLFIVTVYEGKHIVGIAPLYKEKTSLPIGIPSIRIGLLGDKTLGAGYLDFIAEKSREEHVLNALCRTVLADTDWQALSFVDVISNSRTITAMREAAQGAKHAVALTRISSSICIPLPDTWEEFIQQPDVAFEATVKNKSSKLTSSSLDFKCSCSGNCKNIDDQLDALFALNNDRPELCNGPAQLRSLYGGIAKSCCKNDHLHISQLQIDGHTEAMQCGVWSNSRYYGIYSACSKRGSALRAGDILKHKLLESLIGNTSEFTHLHKTECENHLWGAPNLSTVNLTVGRGLAGKLYVLVARIRSIKQWIRNPFSL
jgi:CelD/BcsL family acetyltransferase involved in cellulose biosynthesis